MLEKLELYSNSNNVAYINGKSSITYKELWNKARKFARYLSVQGTNSVIVYGHKSENMIISFFACIIARRAYVPIDVSVPKERIDDIIKLSGATLFIKNESIFINGIDCISDIDIGCDREVELVSNNDIAYIIFTSGSTGIPKGVVITYDNLGNFIGWISNLYTLKNRDNVVVMNQAIYSFDLSVADIYYSLANGHTLVAVNKSVQENVNDLIEIMVREKINILVMTPTMVKFCLLSESFKSDVISSLDTIFFCGEILDIKTVMRLKDRFPDLNVINAYGPTEATCAVTGVLVTKEMLNEGVLPVGDMRYNATEVFIDSEEIVLSGPSVFKGYLGNGEETVNYHTGDIGYIKDNLIYCVGRSDNQIKYSGYRIELEDIESNMLTIEGVYECVVVAVRDRFDKIIAIKAYVILHSEISVLEIKDRLSLKLPSYMIPKTIVVMDEMPVNNNGKYDRKLLSIYE